MLLALPLILPPLVKLNFARWVVLFFAFALLAWPFIPAQSAAAQKATPPAQQASDREIEEIRIGLDGNYKLGHWTPVFVKFSGGSSLQNGRLEITTLDDDGTEAVFVSELEPSSDPSAGLWAYVKFGRPHSGLTVRLLNNSSVISEKKLRVDELSSGSLSTVDMILSIGSEVELSEAIRIRHRSHASSFLTPHIGELSHLPDRWQGYDSVDILLLTTSNVESIEQLSSQQLSALEQWVGLGGHLILSVGSGGEAWLAEQGPLRSFSPGKFSGVISQQKTSGLENYVSAQQRLELSGTGVAEKAMLKMSVIENFSGNAEAYEDSSSANRRPIVIRSPHGFGQVVFFAFDLDQPPIAAWPDRPRLIAKLLFGTTEVQLIQSDGNIGQISHIGFNDIYGQLRSALEQFDGVMLVPFSLVAALILVYLIFIGPVDYYLLKRINRGMHWTWVSFPVLVLAFCFLAYFLADRWKGDEIKFNEVDLVDVDLESRLIRGTTWAHVFSPRSEAFDISLQLEADQDFEGALLCWQGLPGNWLGGMNSPTASATFETSYAIHPANGEKRAELKALPIQVSSSKGLSARWWGKTEQLSKGSQLSVSAINILEGQISNPLSVELSDCYLCWRNYYYPIRGKFAPGDTFYLEDAGFAKDLEWKLTQRKVIEANDVPTPWDKTIFDVPRIMEMIMFYQAAGGDSYTGITNRIYSELDLSAHLRTGRAILVGRSATRPCEITTAGKPQPKEGDTTWTFYRIVYPVER